MKTDELKFPKPVLDILKKEITELNPPQEKAIKAGLLDGTSIVVASPTASGKTLIAELAILKKFLASEKSVYLVPLKALASEKYEDFKKKYESIGMRVAVSTGDLDNGDEWLGSYDVIIASNEKMDSLLRHNAKWVPKISLIVADEIHLIDDASRGPTLEIVLTKLRQVTKSQILALSATIKNADEIAKWLGAKLVCSDYRPIKLHKAVAYDDDNNYVIDFVEKKPEKLSLGKDPELIICNDTLKKNKQALIFVANRRSAESAAEKISVQTKKLLTDEEKSFLSALSEEAENVLSSPTKQCRRLSSIVKGGAAFHHAGLVAAQRKLIEENFKTGKIKFIVSTPTLAFGVNMPAYRVIIRDLKRFDSANYGSYYIPNFEVQQMCGRAGRPKYDKEGEAIIIAKTRHEAQDLKSRYLTGELEPIYSKLSAEPVLRLHVLGLVASQAAETKKQLENFFSKTFFAHQYNDIDEVMERVEKILEELRSYKFIEYVDEKFISSDFKPAFALVDDVKFKATKTGRRVAELYIDPLSAKTLIDNMNAGNNIDYLTIINQCTEMRPLLRVKNSDDIEPSNLKIKVPDVWDIRYDDFLESYKTALMLTDWTNEITEDKLLERYGIAPGELYNKTSNAEWLSLQE
ncbi:DEAD/DEAH box helicase [archaeon]|nr:DEAD/DEAH box helicase [archaeon]